MNESSSGNFKNESHTLPPFEAYGRTWEGLIDPFNQNKNDFAWLAQNHKHDIIRDWAANRACWYFSKLSPKLSLEEYKYTDIQNDMWQELYEAALEAEEKL